MNAFHDPHGTRWVPASHLAREFNKTRITIRRWCATGFILTLGYRTMRDVRGHWLVAPLCDPRPSAETEHSELTPLRF
jgi:hypothetical protein